MACVMSGSDGPETPLIRLLRCNAPLEVLRCLIRGGADVDPPTTQARESPIYVAVELHGPQVSR